MASLGFNTLLIVEMNVDYPVSFYNDILLYSAK